MAGIIFGALLTLYGVANMIFAFVPAPPALERFLGPDRRTRGLLFFVPDSKIESVGRLVYGLACLLLPAIILYYHLRY